MEWEGEDTPTHWRQIVFLAQKTVILWSTTLETNDIWSSERDAHVSSMRNAIQTDIEKYRLT